MLRCTTSFQEFCSNQASDDELELKEDYSCKTVRVNIYGKKIWELTLNGGSSTSSFLPQSILSPNCTLKSRKCLQEKERMMIFVMGISLSLCLQVQQEEKIYSLSSSVENNFPL